MFLAFLLFHPSPSSLSSQSFMQVETHFENHLPLRQSIYFVHWTFTIFYLPSSTHFFTFPCVSEGVPSEKQPEGYVYKWRDLLQVVLCDCKSWVSLTLVGPAIRKAGWKLSGRCWCCWNVCFLRENSFLYLKPFKGLNQFHPDNPG